MHTTPKLIPPLDKEFCPAALANRAFLALVNDSNEGVPLKIALERGGGQISTYETQVFGDNSKLSNMNRYYVERLVKTLLWIKGGWKITIGGPANVGEYIKTAYAMGGIREFDAKFMSKVYEKPFIIEITSVENVPVCAEKTTLINRNLNGCRIGFDAGGSDRKVSAVIDGEVVYSEEVVWHPKTQCNPDYHFNEILTALRTAASHMPRIDSIGVSAAGIYLDNRVMIASLFLKVPEELFEIKVKNLFLNIQKQMGDIPLEIVNDGDVTALAGAIEINDTNVLGIAMGTSEAGGYIDNYGNITGWLNELAFVPVDFNPTAAIDEWSGDFGCGVKYFSQDAVIKLALAAGIPLDDKTPPGENLKIIQELLEKGDVNARLIFESIGCYLGYGIAHYADFYDIKHVLILGRVTSGEGGNIILETAKMVLVQEFPKLASQIKLHLPDESNRRIGQSIAAASLCSPNV